MCTRCFTQEHRSFPTWQAFEQFDLALTQKIQLSGGLHYSGQKQLARLPICTSYTCAACGTEWWLSEPDSAWRGFFLPKGQAKAHLTKLRGLDNVRGWVGLALLAGLLLGALWLLRNLINP